MIDATGSEAMANPILDLESVLDDESLDEKLVPPRRSTERRNDVRRRIEVDLRFQSHSQGEQAGSLLDISISGVRVKTSNVPAEGEDIIMYIDKIGRFNGRVIRAEHEVFAAKIDVTGPKLKRLEDAMSRFFEESFPDSELSDRRKGTSERRHFDRSSSSDDQLTGHTSSNEAFKCSVLNISLGGIEIETTAQLALGESVTVGVVKGVIIRRTEQGYAIKRSD